MVQAQFNTDAPMINLIGMAAEVKLDDKTSSPIWQCFHNMSAIGASVTMKALTLGVIVNRMVVYGLVLSIEMRDRCKLLQLVMDYDHHVCLFYECDSTFPLDLLINAIVAHLFYWLFMMCA